MNERPAQTESGRTAPALKTAGRGLAVLAAIAAFWMLGKYTGQYVPLVARSIADLGPAGPAAFILAYAVAVVAFVPGSILTLAAGALFGVVKGTAYVFVAATLGACAAFLVSRYIARSRIEQRLAADERFEAIDRAIAKEGRKIVFLLRLSPVFPFSLLNYALGLTKVRLVDYTVGCIGMLPGTVLYVYYGKLAGDVASAIGGGAPERGAEYYAVLLAGLVATVVVTALVTRTAKRALKEVSDV